MIRLFTAIAIPEQIRQRLSLMQGGVPGTRWSPVDNLHLTLRFIGEVDHVVARDIDSVLAGLHMNAFDLALKSVGEFGGKEPRALWAGVRASEPLSRLAAKIETALQRMGLEAETRKYTPHVTLARLKDAPLPKVSAFLAAHSLFDSGQFHVTTFGLYSSHQSSRGSQYILERSYELDPAR
ncbi:MAG: RNA 2',3'-cyclic phosphodiesterase [Micropepsaceae bacterium]